MRMMSLVAALLVGVGVAGCGKESLAEQMAGMYATDAVQADLEEHEKEVFGEDLHGKFDSVDKAEAEEAGAVWARLRLHADGRFEYEGPASPDGRADAGLGGRWTARSGFVDLTVERSNPAGADVPKTIACPATPRSIDLPFLAAAGRGAVRLAKR